MSAFFRKCEENESDDEDDDCTTSIKRSYSADCMPGMETDDTSDDSDAEFLVHPCLRSLIKSKSYHDRADRATPTTAIKNSKTSFEISLHQMLTSTTKILADDHEHSVADLLPTIDERWPDPSGECAKRPSTLARYSPSASDTSLDIVDRRDGRSWSAPPIFSESLTDCRITPIDQKCWSGPDLSDYPDIGHTKCVGYPMIETPCSYRLPSPGCSERVRSPSPPRPLSPVFGRPPCRHSHSVNLRQRPDIEAFLENIDDDVTGCSEVRSSVSSESDETVWPVCGHIPRQWATMQFETRDFDAIHVSRSAHSQLYNWGAGGDLAESEHSQLDDEERRALRRREEWMQRGSVVRLETRRLTDGAQSQYGSYSSLDDARQTLRRSCTTDEFRRRRRLPRRPDEVERIGMVSTRSEWRVRPPTLAIPQATINTIIDSKRSAEIPMDPYAHLETPISPHAFLPSPSPSSSGRRLPPLPVNSAVLLQRIPYNMSIPPIAKNQQDHTLCFMDGMTDSVMDRSGPMDDSYYEEDGLNGNQQRKRGRRTFFEDSSGVSSCTTSDSMNPTHRVHATFHPRHQDEVMLEIGDAMHVDRTADDHWCYGTNLRTGQSGIFPSAVVCEIDLVDEICQGAMPSNTGKIMSDERDTFYLTMLASIEVAHHKGNDVLVQAMNKVLCMYKNSEEIIVPQTVLMEISFRGIHVIDKRRKNFFQCPMFDFFFSLQNISFCGAHPKQLKYFGFITKHPLLPRFACHVFMSTNSTQPIVESIGRAFKRSYDEYMAFAHPTEDIYLE